MFFSSGFDFVRSGFGGILFQDISTLLLDTKAFKDNIDLFVERYKDKEISVVAGVEARGFIFGPPIALAIGAKFVPLRKPKKLPDVKAVMKNLGTAMLGLLPFNQLIGSSIQSATGVVYNITGGGRKLLLVVGAGSPFFFAPFLGLMKSANYCKCSGPSVNITFGAVVDDRYNGELHVTIIATGFSQSFQKTLLINKPQGSKAA
ncbi:hypothetical protein FF1_027136 [Malus domestica]